MQCHRGVAVREPVGWLFAIAHAKLADLHRRGAVDRRARRRLGVAPVSVEDEIAAAGATSEQVVRKRVSRALSRLRRILEVS